MTATLGIAMFGVPFGVQAIAESSVLRMVDCLFAGTLIAVCASLVSCVSRRQGSSVRFAVWFSALMAVAASPLLSGIVWSRGENVAAGFARAAITLPASWALFVFSVWAGVTVWSLIRLGVGLSRLHALRATLVPVDLAKLDAQVSETLNRGQGGPVSLCSSGQVHVPAVIGLFAPVVVVPPWVLDELSASELNQVLLHEMAHLDRRDGWTNLAQQIIKAVFFFHPAVWWIESKVSLEREMACDDAVLAETESPRAYAECLQHLAERTLLRRGLALVQAVLGRVRQTSMRVAQILDPSHPRSAKHGWRAVFSLATLVIAGGLIEANAPHLIGFQDGRPPASTVAVAPYVLPPVTPVSFKTTEFKTTEAVAPTVSRPSSARAITNKSNHVNAVATHAQFQRAARNANAKSLLLPASMRRTEVRSPRLIASEAVFVMFENWGYSPSGQPVFEIEVVHVTVLHPSIPSNNDEIPHKEI
jgi:beta-lactamase regulating signal transducer with metallopeptidase domain